MNDVTTAAAQGQAQDKIDLIDVERIMEMIPHRYPLLLVDRIIDVVPGVSAIGIKNVTIGEPCFTGHFPRRPVMPGVMIIESMAQTAAVLVVATLGPSAESKLVYFMSVEKARFRKPVTPGDTMYIHVTKEQHRKSVWKFSAEAKVNGKVVAEATYTAMIMDD
ncbi:3-hydroxyacyl-ACP dehydratase FabZ [Oceanibaculum pacificum]|uniref:3-hydroxyacyl-[acyl-carrier-protein] dehydratase FabZ n=1 Tax=Oceanibaculum pacificum TaxID=580166 RepID=A0A154W104_9PROT|nr:3-hydroxyacyl-ACP dehydratase FabZ [Oceanibaculum pacificum]KZD07190.1 3-hydroxyacyl-[acyl-carrier-protein] dehydratase FabZ [Oceanibaculum pacificum]